MAAVSTSYKCKSCSHSLTADQNVCSYCGSSSKNIHISVLKEIKIRESFGLKKFTQEIKDFVVHLKQGWFHSDDTQRHQDGVQLMQLVDRENNVYKKKVVDEKTCKVVKDLEESFDQHH